MFCPACEQSTSHLDTHEAYTQELREKIAEEEEYFAGLKERDSEIQDQQDEIGVVGEVAKTFYSKIDDALEHRHNLETLKSQLEDKADEVNPYVDQIEGLKETGLQEISFETMNELTYLKDHQEFLYKLLTSKDSFIRKKIIDQNIAYLNHRLAHYFRQVRITT